MLISTFPGNVEGKNLQLELKGNILWKEIRIFYQWYICQKWFPHAHTMPLNKLNFKYLLILRVVKTSEKNRIMFYLPNIFFSMS